MNTTATPDWVKTVPGQTACVANPDLYLKLSDEEERNPPSQASAPARAKEAERAELITYMRLTARHLCEGCPLFADCLHDAVTGPPIDGFVAGTTGQEREQLRQVLDVPAQRSPRPAGVPSVQGETFSPEALDEALHHYPEASNAAIARILGCCAHTVGRHRRRRAAQQDQPAHADVPATPTPDDTQAAFQLVTETAA